MNSYTYENNYDENELKLPVVTNTTVFAAIYLRSNTIAKHHYRSSEKINKYVSYIGGFWSILYFFFKLVGKMYNTQLTNTKIVNQLYDFKVDHDESQIKLNFYSKKPIQLNSKINIPVSASVKLGGSGKKIENRPMALTQKIQNFIESQKSIKLLSDCSFLFYFCLRRKNNSLKKTQSILRNKAKFAMQKDLDIVHLLKKINSFEKLLMVLFNKDQHLLFDFFDKITINLNNYDHLKGRSTKIFIADSLYMKSNSPEDNLKEYLKLFKSYMAIKNDKNDGDNLNSKILCQIKSEIREIFDEEVKNGRQNFL